jgi:hypothetical protein
MRDSSEQACDIMAREGNNTLWGFDQVKRKQSILSMMTRREGGLERVRCWFVESRKK